MSRSREYRRVAPDWRHPKDDEGRYLPLLSGNLAQLQTEWDLHSSKWAEGLRPDYHGGFHAIEEKHRALTFEQFNGGRPRAEDYMPQWSREVATGWQLYQIVSEGTPVSPVLLTARAMAEWLLETYGDFTVEDYLEDVVARDPYLT